MITFKEYLTEARMAPLYHGTFPLNAALILRSNRIEANYSHGGETKVPIVSLTRDIRTAITWRSGTYKNGSVVFELDQGKLAQKYKIVPIEVEYLWKSSTDRKSYPPKGSKLYEEYVTKDIQPLEQYLKHVIISESMYNYLRTTDDVGRDTRDTILNHHKLKIVKDNIVRTGRGF